MYSERSFVNEEAMQNMRNRFHTNPKPSEEERLVVPGVPKGVHASLGQKEARSRSAKRRNHAVGMVEGLLAKIRKTSKG